MADIEKSGPTQLGDLRESSAAFDLPFSIDIVEARNAEPEFRAILNEPVTAELRSSTDII